MSGKPDFSPRGSEISEEINGILVPSFEKYRGEDFKTVQSTLIVDHLNKCVISEDTLIVNAFGNLYASFTP